VLISDPDTKEVIGGQLDRTSLDILFAASSPRASISASVVLYLFVLHTPR